MQEVKHRLKLALEIRNMTQKKLSDLTGLSTGLIHDYISGRSTPKQANAFKLAAALRVNPLWLWGADVPFDADVPELTGAEALVQEINNRPMLQKLIETVSDLEESQIGQLIAIAETFKNK